MLKAPFETKKHSLIAKSDAAPVEENRYLINRKSYSDNNKQLKDQEKRTK